MSWSYEREEREFEVLPEGTYRVRVKSVDKGVSKNGNDKITVQLDVSGHDQILFHTITFLPDNPKMTNRMLTQFFDSFKDIAEGELTNLVAWIGKIGACKVKHDEYNGKQQAKVSYFIHADKQGDLPAWVEPKRSEGGESPSAGFNPVASADELPFD